MADVLEPEDLEVAALAPSWRRGTFAAMAVAAYRQLWLGNVLSFVAIQMQAVARGWLALELTGSNAGLGGVFLAFGLPMLVVTPFAGVAADRLPKRRLLLAAQLAMAASGGLLAAAILADAAAYWMLVAAGGVQGLAFSVLGPARLAFTSELVGRPLLGNAVVLQQMAMNGSKVVGPSLGGALVGVAAVGPGGVYLLSTGLLVAAVVNTALLPPGAPSAHARTSAAAELADGVRYVRDRPQLALLIGTAFVVVMAAFPYVAFLPAISEDLFDAGPGGFGLLSAATAVGAVGVSLVIATRAGGDGALRLQTAAGFGFGGGVVALAVAPGLGVALLAAVVLGAASSAYQSLNNSLVLERTETRFHGRVQALNMLSFSGFGLAALPLGAVADAAGLRQTLVGMGTVTVAAMVAYSVAARRVLARWTGPAALGVRDAQPAAAAPD